MLGRIDPNLGRWCGDGGCAARKTLGVCLVGAFEHGLPLLERFSGKAVMHLSGRQEAQPAVVMVVVVPVKVVDAEAPAVFERAKAIRENLAGTSSS